MVNKLQNNMGMTVFYSFFIIINLAVFCVTLFFRDSSWLLSATSALGKCLLLDTALLPITVCRRILAWIRETPLHVFAPLDNHRKIHRTLGLTVCIIAVAHSAGAIAHYYVKSRQPGSPSLFSLLFNVSHHFGWLNLGLLNISGIACLVIVLIIVSTSLLRHHMTFLAFFLTHQLYLALYGLMIIHAGSFWVYLILPVCLWSAELLLRVIYSPRASNILEVTLLPSNVVVVVLERPPKMIFKPGDYLFIQIPTIGKFEWVKFTITSAPEQQDLLTIHVRITNNWTFRLRNYFLRDVSFHYIPHRLQALESITVIQKVVKSWRNMFGGFQNIEVPMGKPRETRKERLQRNRVDAMKVEEKHLTMDVVLSDDDLAPEPEPAPAAASRQSIPPQALAEDPQPLISYTAMRRGGPVAETSQFGGHPVNYSTFTHDYGKTLRFGMSARVTSTERARFQRVKHHSLIPELDDRDATSTSIGESSLAASQERRLRPPLTPAVVPSPASDATPPAGTDGRTHSAAPPASKVPRLPDIDGHRPPLSAPPRPKGALPGSTLVTELAGDEDTSIVSSMKRRRLDDDLGDGGDDMCDFDDTIKVFIDGPYGNSGSERTGIFSASHAVIVLVGPNVNPFSAVLQSILIRYRSEIVPCPNCACEFKMELPSSFMSIRRVDFIWVTSDMEGFEWFLELLEDMDNYQKRRNLLENFLEFYLFKTGLKPMPSFTPLRKRLQQGKPRWEELLREIVGKSGVDVEVFFSGPKTARKTVKNACADIGLIFNTTSF